MTFLLKRSTVYMAAIQYNICWYMCGGGMIYMCICMSVQYVCECMWYEWSWVSVYDCVNV